MFIGKIVWQIMTSFGFILGYQKIPTIIPHLWMYTPVLISITQLLPHFSLQHWLLPAVSPERTNGRPLQNVAC